LGVVSVILIITVVEVTIVATYVQLCSENYHWWWQSFLVGGSSSIWIFGYLTWYYFTSLHISGFVSSLLFFLLRLPRVSSLWAAYGHDWLFGGICIC